MSNCERPKKKSIFSNCFTLNLENEKIQQKYEAEIREKNLMMIIFLFVMAAILIIGFVLLNVIDFSNVTQKLPFNTKGLMFYGYFCLIFLSISYILYFFNLKFPKVGLALLYFNLVTLTMTSSFFVFLMKELLADNDLFMIYDFAVYSVYFTVTISYIVFLDNNFASAIAPLSPIRFPISLTAHVDFVNPKSNNSKG